MEVDDNMRKDDTMRIRDSDDKFRLPEMKLLMAVVKSTSCKNFFVSVW